MERLSMPFVALVKLIITHIRPHLDEIAAWWLAIRHGLSFFPGLDKAKLVLWNAGNRTPDGRTPRQWKERDGALLLGVGGAKTEENPDGAEFDEHGRTREFDEHGRERKTCTFVLMLEALGLKQDPRFRELHKFTLSNDREGNSSHWDAAKILKALNAHTVSILELAKLYFDILDAHINRTTLNDPEWNGHKHAVLFDGHLAQWIWEKFAGNAADTVDRPATSREVIEFLRIGGRADLSTIKRLSERDHTKGSAAPFDIVTMFSELVDNGADGAYQKYYVYVIVNAYFAQQLRFIAAAEEVATQTRVTWMGDANVIARMQKPRVVEDRTIAGQIAELESDAAKDPATATETAALIKELRTSLTKPPVIRPGDNVITDHMEGIKPFKVVTVVTDNEEVLKELRGSHPDAQFAMRRQTSNHTVINGPKQHLMDSVAVEVRGNEYMLRKGSLAPKVPAEQFRRAGNIPEEPAWCYHREGRQLLNGSLTSPGDPCTLQSVEALEKRIARGVRHAAMFDPRLRFRSAAPPRRPSGKPHGKPAVSQAPKAQGNRHHDGRNRSRNHGKRSGGAGHDGRRHDRRPVTATSGGGFENKPFAKLPPAALMPPPVVIETPAPAPAEPAIPVPVADASPVSVTEVPSTEHLAMPEPAAPPSAPAPKATRKPRVRKAAPKSGKKAAKA